MDAQTTVPQTNGSKIPRPTERGDTEHLDYDPTANLYRLKTNCEIDQLTLEERQSIISAGPPVKKTSGRHRYTQQARLSLQGKVMVREIAEANNWDIGVVLDACIQAGYRQLTGKSTLSPHEQALAALGVQ